MKGGGLIILQGDAVVIMGGTGGLGHLALQMGGRGMGFRMIVMPSISH